MADKLDLVFKKAVNREYTSPNKAWYQEMPGVPWKLKGSDVWIEPIPITPPTVTDTKIEYYNPFTLTEDTSVGQKRAWVACSHQTPGGDPASGRVGNFISPRYGSDYGIKLYDHENDEIPLTHDSGWYFNYEAGILTFDNAPGGYGINTTSFKIVVWRYIGLTADDFVKYDEPLGHLFINPSYTVET